MDPTFWRPWLCVLETQTFSEQKSNTIEVNCRYEVCVLPAALLHGRRIGSQIIVLPGGNILLGNGERWR